MKFIKHYTIILAFILPTLSYAHSMNIARFEIQSQDKKDYLIVNFTFHAVKEVLKSELDFDHINQQADLIQLKSATVKYIKSHTNIVVNGEVLKFGAGSIKLGHSSILRLEIKNLPSSIQTIDANISCFQDIAHQNNLLIMKLGDFGFRENLTAKNDFEASFIEESYAAKGTHHITSLYVLSIALFLVALGFMMRYRHLAMRNLKIAE